MIRGRARAVAAAALALAGAVAIGGCGGNGGTSTGGAVVRTPSVLTGSTVAGCVPGTPGDTCTPAGPTSGWGPDMWSDHGGSGMMGGASDSWGPGMMGNWWLAGDGNRVRTFDQARRRAAAFADRLGLEVGEIMRFSRNFYAELHTTGGDLATEVLVNPADGAVQIEYGPAMMWNTDYGMHHGGRSGARVSAAQAGDIARKWLRDHDTTLTAGDAEPYPGYYTLHTMRSGKITGMLSVNSSTGQVWYHTWHGAYVATSER